MNHQSVTLEFSRDGGQTWECIGEARVDLSDPKSWGTADTLLPDGEVIHLDQRHFTFKPKKAPKVRQTPPFWSAYK